MASFKVFLYYFFCQREEALNMVERLVIHFEFRVDLDLRRQQYEE